MVQGLSTNTRPNAPLRASHNAAACGWFKPSLQIRAPTLLFANPITRQRVDGSRPLYKYAPQRSSSRIPQRGSVWMVQALSTNTRPNAPLRESHNAAACGWFKASLQIRAPTLLFANPTTRQRVDGSSPLYKYAPQRSS